MVKLKKKKKKENLSMSGDCAPLLNRINVSTNHLLTNSIVIAFIDLHAGEKCDT